MIKNSKGLMSNENIVSQVLLPNKRHLSYISVRVIFELILINSSNMKPVSY